MSFDGRRFDALAAALGHARRIARWTLDDTRESYLDNEERQFAVERAFIALGEAIKDAGVDELAAVAPEVEWRLAARFRDFLAHRYDEAVSHPSIWDSIQTDLPGLITALERLTA